ncbi:MAG: hypothetical protein GVY36_13475 [Verrucomicrobia bacterium]|jgi:hypothetical protein|nr:hypothetical protein [Verrucomicrobiota bacterium]
MNEHKNNKIHQPETTDATKKPGLFGRIFQKLDDSMKQKADEQSQQSCCGGKDDKGGKCC